MGLVLVLLLALRTLVLGSQGAQNRLVRQTRHLVSV
jgi:hypothetical protein